MANGVTNKDLYNAVTDVRTEGKADNLRLETKVETLTSEVAKLRTTQATTSLKIGIISFIGGSMMGGIISVIGGLISKKVFGI